MYTINEIIATLLTVGGVGYINFYTLLHMGLIQTAKDKDKHILPICLIFSLFDFAIYICLQQWLKRIPALSVKANTNWLIFWNIMLTMILAFVLTLVLGNIAIKLFYWFINKTRLRDNKAEVMQSEPFIDALNDEKQAQAFIYDFSHNSLGCGHVLSSSIDSENNYQLNLEPFTSDEDQYSYDALMAFVQTKEWKDNYKITNHINFKQNFIMVLIQDK